MEECSALLEKEAVALSPHLGPLRTLPLHAGLGAASQRVYEAEVPPPPPPPPRGPGGAGEAGRRRVVLTDTLAEASFSMPGIRYVIDTGLQIKTVSSAPGGRLSSGGRAVVL